MSFTDQDRSRHVSVLMNVDHRIGEWERTSAPSCRDRGWMQGWVGALCLSCWPHDAVGCHHAEGPHPNEDRHKAPTSAPPLPLSLQWGSGRRPL